ncbi:MAG: cellulase family glycosylhydrolase [Demequinaceae bacterium]|nr:cellulase family glycosylhydrolase [Demequinaceae bacterium]
MFKTAAWGAMALLLITMTGCVASGSPTPPTPTDSHASPLEIAPNGDAAPRGRVQLANGTVVTDRGTLVRGAYWAVDHMGLLPDREDLADIRGLGLNALHLYGEMYGDGVPAGGYVDQIDVVVQWCGELGLYCVLTIGNGATGLSFDYQFATDFWNFYAPRYADMPWVVYEIYNEPEYLGAPSSDDTIQLNQDMYDLIRSHAPDTHVLFFSYSGLTNSAAVLQDVQRLDVDWSNASVAWHGYTSLSSNETCLTGMREAGINSIHSELPVGQCCDPGWDEEDPPWWSDPFVNTDKIRMAEENHTSWLTHIDVDYIHDDWRFKEPIEESGICWEPDYGTWPSEGCSD